jgi:hypothetical protein
MSKPRNEKQRRLALAYQRTFCGDGEAPHVNAETVLADLAKQACMGDRAIVVSRITGVVDDSATMYRAGLRDMFLRITGMLGLDPATPFTPEETPHEHPMAQS